MKGNWFHAGMATLLAASCLSMGCGKVGEGDGKAAALTFQNPNSADLNLVLSGGFDGQFRVQAGESVTIAPHPVKATTIRIEVDSAVPPDPAGMIPPKAGPAHASAPEVGESTAVQAPHWSVFRFVTDYASELWVTLDGEHSFAIRAGVPEEYAFEPGKNVEIEYYPLYNNRDYEETSFRPGRLMKAAPRGGMTNEVKLVLHHRGNTVAPIPATVATLTLTNPNDQTVIVVLTDDNGTSKRWLMPAHSTANREVQTGIKTEVKYFANNDRYMEDSMASAKAITVTGQADLDLKLTEKAKPTLTVTNDGEVPLSASVKSAGNGRLLGRLDRIEAHKDGVFRDLPAGEELLLAYAAEGHPGYRGGDKRITGLNWGDKGQETVRATVQGPPTIEIRNTGFRTVKVTVSHNGHPAEDSFELDGKSNRVLQFDEAGEYRVQTEAVIGREDPSGRKEDYNAIDRIVGCEWGDEPVVVECDANEKPDPGYPPEKTEQDRAIQGALKAASGSLERPWSVHSAADTIARIAQNLSAAKRYGNGEDVDGIVENVHGVLAYDAWRATVGRKRQSATEDKDQTVLGDERWQHIVETTQRSGSWNEFLANY